MRVLVLGFAKMKFMPYASFYLENIDIEKNDIDFIYWNRDKKSESLNNFDSRINFIEFKEYIDDSIGKRHKLKYFYKYRKFVSAVLSKQHYDCIIVLHSLPGLLILDKLLCKYRKKFILDYRDSTFEKNFIFGGLVRIMAKNAKIVFVSSDGFRKFLPTRGVKIITSHNLLLDSLNHRDDRRERYQPGKRIRISFWGRIRHIDHNLQIISRLGNDPRFELHYYGKEFEMGQIVRDFLQKNNINNVFFHGEYMPVERYKFACQTDILHNSYYDANTLLAMGNKYYDGIIFRIPQLCMSGSYMAERCKMKGVGFSFDPKDDNYANEVYEAYIKLNNSEFESNCDKELDSIMKEYISGGDYLRKIFNR